MSKLNGYIETLADEIGPRPATSEAEYRAAEWIASEFEQHELEPQMQEFRSPSTYGWAFIIYNFLTIVAAVLSGLFPWARIPALIVALAVAVILWIDLDARWSLSSLMPKHPSQNVIARYLPKGNRGTERKRKIVVVAHYDTARSSLAFAPKMVQNFPLTFSLMKWCTTLVPVLVLAQILVPATIRPYVWYATIVVSAYLLVPLVVNLHRELFGAYVEGANDNASGVTALLGVLDRVLPIPGEEEEMTVHGEEEAYRAGVVPPGATLEYDEELVEDAHADRSEAPIVESLPFAIAPDGKAAQSPKQPELPIEETEERPSVPRKAEQAESTPADEKDEPSVEEAAPKAAPRRPMTAGQLVEEQDAAAQEAKTAGDVDIQSDEAKASEKSKTLDPERKGRFADIPVTPRDRGPVAPERPVRASNQEEHPRPTMRWRGTGGDKKADQEAADQVEKSGHIPRIHPGRSAKMTPVTRTEEEKPPTKPSKFVGQIPMENPYSGETIQFKPVTPDIPEVAPEKTQHDYFDDAPETEQAVVQSVYEEEVIAEPEYEMSEIVPQDGDYDFPDSPESWTEEEGFSGGHPTEEFGAIPESRVHEIAEQATGFFQRVFSRKKKKEQEADEEGALDDWLDSREGSEYLDSIEHNSWDEGPDDDDGFNWRGGAVMGDDAPANLTVEERIARIKEAVLAEVDRDLLDKEVWFVATGAEEVGTVGMKSFLKEYGNELRGALIINIDNVGYGDLCWLEREGMAIKRKADRRLKVLAKRVARTEKIDAGPGKFGGLSTDGSTALMMGHPAITFMALDGKVPAEWHWKTDVIENLDMNVIHDTVDLVSGMIREL